MLQFLQTYWVTIVVLAIVLLAVILAVRSLVKNKKAGIGACGHKCADCPHNCAGHQQ